MMDKNSDINATIAGALFAKTYYSTLPTDRCKRFYREDSQCSYGDERIGQNAIKLANNLKSIHDLLSQSKPFTIELKTIDSEFLGKGIFMAVIGSVTSDISRRFCQSFFLEMIGNESFPCYYVKNDILRYLDTPVPCKVPLNTRDKTTIKPSPTAINSNHEEMNNVPLKNNNAASLGNHRIPRHIENARDQKNHNIDRISLVPHTSYNEDRSAFNANHHHGNNERNSQGYHLSQLNNNENPTNNINNKQHETTFYLGNTVLPLSVDTAHSNATGSINSYHSNQQITSHGPYVTSQPQLQKQQNSSHFNENISMPQQQNNEEFNKSLSLIISETSPYCDKSKLIDFLSSPKGFNWNGITKAIVKGKSTFIEFENISFYEQAINLSNIKKVYYDGFWLTVDRNIVHDRNYHPNNINRYTMQYND